MDKLLPPPENSLSFPFPFQKFRFFKKLICIIIIDLNRQFQQGKSYWLAPKWQPNNWVEVSSFWNIVDIVKLDLERQIIEHRCCFPKSKLIYWVDAIVSILLFGTTHFCNYHSIFASYYDFANAPAALTQHEFVVNRRTTVHFYYSTLKTRHMHMNYQSSFTEDWIELN